MRWDETLHMGEQGMKHGGMLTSYKHRTDCGDAATEYSFMKDWLIVRQRLMANRYNLHSIKNLYEWCTQYRIY